MTIDERLDRLAASQEKTQQMLAQIVETMHWFDENQRKTQVMLAEMMDSIKRLERIAVSHEMRMDDMESVLAALEGRRRKPQ